MLRSALAALILLAISALPVAADHGYWPESGVEPAVVAGHEPRTQPSAEAGTWGSACTRLGQSGREATLDVYGHILETDYAVAVVLAHRDGLPLDGPHAVTIFRSPKAGQFVWADVDGDGEFAGRHEADAGQLILCATAHLPATDTVVPGATDPQPTLGLMLVLTGLLGGLVVLISRPRSE